MSRQEHAAEIADLAAELGLSGAADPVEAILGHCRSRIDRWLADAPGVTTIGQLEDLVTRKLQMLFEEVRSDGDFDRITQQYARARKDPVFATLRMRFDDTDNPSYGALVRRNVSDEAPDRFVAVIDCRGGKLARRFFTRWHEIAHRLTTHADQGATEPAYRSEQDPTERLMDEIAGHVGFYGPFFDPIFLTGHHGQAVLTFGTVEAVRSAGFPEASFQATLNACVRRMPTPVICLEAALGHKVSEKKEIEDDPPRLFPVEPPPAKLRAVRVVTNEPALAEDFVIPWNMRVPVGSLIHGLFVDEAVRETSGREDMSLWESGGKHLDARAVAVEARRFGDWVIAVMQPVGPVRAKRQTKPRKAEGRTIFDV